MWKYLRILKELGPCRIVSAGRRPVGGGWTQKIRKELTDMGYEIVLREDSFPRWTFLQALGMLYGGICKGLGLERAFYHSNPYHRHAFPHAWWLEVSSGADLAVVNYSYWAGLPCSFPIALVLLDIWSDYIWGGSNWETYDIKSCAHTFAISTDEVACLADRGVTHVSWSPPAVQKSDMPAVNGCALVGSMNKFNLEGLRWLESAGDSLNEAGIRVYGALADAVVHPRLCQVGRYQDSDQPYRENGIVAFTTIQGMGVQIKTIEALAAGRAIVASASIVLICTPIP
jgi:hypothetical protein